MLKCLTPLKRPKCSPKALKQWLSALKCSCLFCRELEDTSKNFTQILLGNLMIPKLFNMFAYKYLIITLLRLEVDEISIRHFKKSKPNKPHHS